MNRLRSADVVSNVGLTLVVLALLAGAAVYARRRGWLDRWVSQTGATGRPNRQLSVVESIALSRKARLIRVRQGDREWLLAESDGGVQVLRPEDGREVS